MKIRISLSLLLVLVLSSCMTSTKLRNIEQKLDKSNNFNDILASKYIKYSDVLRKNHDYTSSRYFKRLGIDAYKRRSNFELVFDDRMKDVRPDTLADLHFLFNCWIYYETKNKNLGEATICKDTFIRLKDTVEKEKNISLQQKLINQDEEDINFLTGSEEFFFLEFAKNKSIDIFFDYDNYKLNPESLVKISSILKYISKLKSDYKILVVGHTDRSGKVIYNNTLARKRANTVYNMLIKNGVPRELIVVDSLSSKSPKILTRTNEKSQLNRRVEVIIDTDFRTLDTNTQPLKLTNPPSVAK